MNKELLDLLTLVGQIREIYIYIGLGLPRWH